MTIKKIQEWIKERRGSIVDPDNEGWKEEDEDQEFDERQQVELQFLDELEDFINN